MDNGLRHKVESKFLKVKMDALKKAIKVSKKNFYGYLLTKGIQHSSKQSSKIF